MRNCENCYHYHMCDLQNRLEEEQDCKHYKDKSLIVELPCKVGDTVYCIGSECLADRDSKKCDKLKSENPFLSCDDCPLLKSQTLFERTVTKHFLFLLVEKTNPNFIFNKTVFLTREEAENALRESEKNG